MLDVTDNIVSGQIVPPRGRGPARRRRPVPGGRGGQGHGDVLRHRQRDLRGAQDFWLGDAFASGGSAGYDHKKMGITARGAWESVKRHFRELGLDTQTQDFTVVGVGDMSGDVFGNGMLLSEHIRLVAAFDHRHIFLDPDPDAATSYAERRRLFDLPRSSWEDYDPELISRRRRHLPAYARSRSRSRRRCGRRSAWTTTSRSCQPAGADEGDPHRPGGPVLERRHRHVREGVQPDQRRGGRQVQRRDPGGRRAACAAGWSARAATWAAPSSAGSSTR